MKTLWNEYKQALFETFPDLSPLPYHTKWTGETSLYAREYSSKHFLRIREVEILSSKTNIYNTILYPKTGAFLPCFGMDLMGFFEKKVVITFDFQHPKENYLFSLGNQLPKCTGGIRFFEPGNHFSEHLYVRKCTALEVPSHLPLFKNYLKVYKDLVEKANPSGFDELEYVNFDNYMIKLDPVEGYLASKFGKHKSSQFVKEFLFKYGAPSTI